MPLADRYDVVEAVSHRDASATMFDPAGERIFWSNPAADAPTSAVCHNAGTSCDADGCVPIDRDLQGQPTQAYEQAALRSLIEFQAKLETLRLEREVAVTVIGGVTASGALQYEPSNDDAWIEEFGWGPGCENATGQRAQPPGRLYQLTSPSDAAVSICSVDWSYALDSGVPWDEQLRPWCGPSGVADTDPSTPEIEPDCEVIVRTAIDKTWPVPPCLRDEQGFIVDAATNNYAIPTSADRCYAMLVDAGGWTGDPYDDLSASCVDAGHRLEVQIAARPGTLPLPRGNVYELTCVPE